MHVYLDLNVFDRIEKKERLPESEREAYQALESLILQNKITVPYSNAHLNDLFRGYLKNPAYVDAHLTNIERLTNNLCICQYWNRDKVTWHYRNIHNFFEEKKNERDGEAESFTELGRSIGRLESIELYKFKQLPNKWKEGYQADPLFKIMFPKSKSNGTEFSLMEDIFDFQIRLKTDYSIYKSLKSHLIRSISRLQNNKEYLKLIRQNFKDLPKHLEVLDIVNLYIPENKDLKNKAYLKTLDTFYKFDLKGYKTDGNFNNMFDDSLHTFYGAHCDFFVTNDDRCHYKAIKTYERLGIQTKVIKSNDYKMIVNSL